MLIPVAERFTELHAFITYIIFANLREVKMSLDKSGNALPLIQFTIISHMQYCKHTDLELSFLPRHENHQRPPFLGIFSFMMFSTVAWSKRTEPLILKTQKLNDRMTVTEHMQLINKHKFTKTYRTRAEHARKTVCEETKSGVDVTQTGILSAMVHNGMV